MADSEHLRRRSVRLSNELSDNPCLGPFFMSIPSLTSEQVNQVSALVAEYITVQRAKYLLRARPLSAKQRRAMATFFSPELLDSARLLVMDGERVVNPEFYPMLRSLGFNNLRISPRWEP